MARDENSIIPEEWEGKSAAEQLDAFLASDRRNCYLEDDSIRVYVRKGDHLVDGKPTRTLDIANVVVPEEKRGRGVFGAFLKHAEGKGLPVRIENIARPELVVGMVRHGYRTIEEHRSVIKMPVGQDR
jgi:hypothetical protein